MAWDISADRPPFSRDDDEEDGDVNVVEVKADEEVDMDADFLEEIVDMDVAVVAVVVGKGEGMYCISPSYNSSIDA